VKIVGYTAGQRKDQPANDKTNADHDQIYNHNEWNLFTQLRPGFRFACFLEAENPYFVRRLLRLDLGFANVLVGNVDIYY
jgi:hypothetical protein